MSAPRWHGDHPRMNDLILGRLRLAFSRPDVSPEVASGLVEVEFVAYGEDCLLSGRTVLDTDRLSDMLNAHDEYALVGVTVERLVDGEPIQVDEVVVGRDELILVHASGPRGDEDRRIFTARGHVALKMGPYQVRGFLHGLPGADPVASLRRRKTMVPLTNARIAFEIGGVLREDRVETVILNREQIDWVEEIEPDRSEFPVPTVRLEVDQPNAS